MRPPRATNPRTGGRPARGTAGTNPRAGQASRYVFQPRLRRLRVRGPFDKLPYSQSEVISQSCPTHFWRLRCCGPRPFWYGIFPTDDGIAVSILVLSPLPVLRRCGPFLVVRCKRTLASHPDSVLPVHVHLSLIGGEPDDRSVGVAFHVEVLSLAQAHHDRSEQPQLLRTSGHHFDASLGAAGRSLFECLWTTWQ